MGNTQERQNDSYWTEVIGPKKGLFEINLLELWRYRDLILLFVKRDLLAQYKQTILGPLWFFIQPLFTTFIFLFVFNRIARIPTDNVNPILFYLSGITLWNYFADCFNKTSNTFVANAGVFGKVYFPRLATPVSIVMSNLAKLGIQVILFLIVMCYLMFTQEISLNINLSILLLPYLIFIMAVLGLGAGIIFSSLTTKYRDLSFLLQFGIQLMMYATPIIYPLSYTQGKMRMLISLNPITSIIETFRYSFFGIGQFDLMPLIYTSIFSFVVLGIGIIIFNQVEKSFMDTV
jgi:lipopolysaccharide transport system permease protein